MAVTMRSWLHPPHAHLAAGHEPGHEVAERLEAVALQGGGGAVQRLDALDHEPPVGAERDLRAHALEEQRQLHHLGLGGGVVDHRAALGQHRGEEHRLGGADGRVGQRDPRAAQPARHARGDPLRLHLDLGAHLLEGAHVEVDRPAADAVAADQRHERLVGAVEERPEQEDRDPVEPGELERDARGGLRGRGDGDGRCPR